MAKTATSVPPIPLDFAAVEGLHQLLVEWVRYRSRTRFPMTDRAWTVLWNMLRDACDGDPRRAALVVAWCMVVGYRGIYRPKKPWAEVARLLEMPLPGRFEQRAPAVRKTPAQLASEAEDELAALRHSLPPDDFDSFMKLIRAREEREDRAGLEMLIGELRDRAGSGEAAFEGVGARGAGWAPP